MQLHSDACDHNIVFIQHEIITHFFTELSAEIPLIMFRIIHSFKIFFIYYFLLFSIIKLLPSHYLKFIFCFASPYIIWISFVVIYISWFVVFLEFPSSKFHGTSVFWYKNSTLIRRNFQRLNKIYFSSLGK